MKGGSAPLGKIILIQKSGPGKPGAAAVDARYIFQNINYSIQIIKYKTLATIGRSAPRIKRAN